MSAVRLRFRSELRARWRAWRGLVVIVVVGGGVVIALATGARRTDSAYTRFLGSQDAWDVEFQNTLDAGTATIDRRAIEALPQVAEVATARLHYLRLGGGQIALASPDGRLGRDVNRFKMLAGRRADPDRPGEAVVPFDVADRFGLEVGDPLDLYYDIAKLEAETSPERLSPEDRGYLALLRRIVEGLPGGRLEIVGIEASPSEFPPQFQGGAPVHLTPAFDRLARDVSDGEVMAIRLRNGPADVPAFRRALERLGDGNPLRLTVQTENSRLVQRSIHLQAQALWLLAGLTALVTALVLAQLLSRQAIVESGADDVLNAFGMTSVQRWAVGMARAGAIGLAGTVGALILAVALSPLAPTGLARTAEPDAGFKIDPLALGTGAVAVALGVVALAAWPSWRAVRPRREMAGAGGSTTTFRVAEALSWTGAAVPARIGVQMALEPGRGRTAVPVRTTLAIVSLGIAVLIATVTFGASLTHLIDTPRLYGVGWDVGVTNYNTGPPLEGIGVELARSLPGVSSVTVGDDSLSVEIDGRRTDVLPIDAGEGGILPALLQGRAPRRVDEIALGSRTIDAIGAEIGDRITVRASRSAVHRMRIVGIGVIPLVSESARLGEGGLVTVRGVRRFEPESDDGVYLLMKLRPGNDPQTVMRSLQRATEEYCRQQPDRCPEGSGELTTILEGKPTDIVNFGQVSSTPLLLGAVLAVLAAGALAHVLVSAVGRRRRDLAVLKTLGFVRRQVLATVAWQGIVTVTVALLVGLPLGVALGRWSWSLFASELGIAAEPRVPVPALLVTAVVALALAVLIAIVPARRAAGTPAALALRSE